MAYTAAQLINMGYPGYQGWGDAEANADFNATHGAGKGAPVLNAPQTVNASIEDTFKRLQQEVASKFKSYNQSNPFVVDTILQQKHKLAAEQLDPYYNESLANYLLGTQRKLERGAQDTHDLLSELSGQTQNYTQQTQLRLDDALTKARQGYADVGLFESGQRYRSEGLLNTASNLGTEDFLRRQNYRGNSANLDLQRTQQDFGLGNLQGQNIRDINTLDLSNPGVGPIVGTDIRNLQRERGTAEDTLASQLTKEAGQKYVTGFNATLPPEYQAANNMDLLKQIGIYS